MTAAEKRKANATYHAHCGHMWMANSLRLVGALPADEQLAFVRGMLAVLSKWTHGTGGKLWPVLPRLEGDQPPPVSTKACKGKRRTVQRKGAR